MDAPITCWIYRGTRQVEMYLYLAKEDAFDELPPALMERFGKPTLVMELELHPTRRLARENVSKVIANLKQQGFHLQMPPSIKPGQFLE